VSSTEPSSEAEVELVAGDADTTKVASILYFLDNVFEPAWPFLFLDSAASVAFLVAAFCFFFSIVVRTFGGTSVPRDEFLALQTPGLATA
jgi:hypothetical protein